MTNVVWLFIDSLRKDVFNNTDTLMKKEIFEKGLNLDNCFSQGGWTYPSFASFITGKYPTSNGTTIFNKEKIKWAFFKASKINENESTIFDVLHDQNYKILTICWSVFGEGHDYSKWNLRNESEPIGNIIKWIRENKNNEFFLFIRTNILHYTSWGDERQDKWQGRFDYNKHCKNVEKICFEGREKEIFKKISSLLKEVDNNIFAPLFNTLNKEGLFENTLFIINSDHGDCINEFIPRINNIYTKIDSSGKNGINNFGVMHVSCFDEVIKVPCAIRYDKKIPNKKISSMTRLIDILPTIAPFIGFEDKHIFDGNDLLNQDELNNIKNFYCEAHRSVCLRTNSKKLIYYPWGKKIFLFDLEKDPSETNPIEDDSLKKYLLGILNKDILKGKIFLEELNLIDESEIKKRLRNLGYID